jgi:hypothetical protein
MVCTLEYSCIPSRVLSVYILYILYIYLWLPQVDLWVWIGFMVYTAADPGSFCPRASISPPLIFPPANRVLSACPRASIFFFWFSHHPKGCFLPDYQRVPKLKRNKKVRKRTEKRQKKGTGKVTTRALQPKGCFLPDCQKVPKLKRSQKVTKKEPGKKYRKKETHKSTCRSHTISSSTCTDILSVQPTCLLRTVRSRI